jgi:colanic acid biosynthesis glycosyl transferase WcaI
MRVLLVCSVYPPENAPAGIMMHELAVDLMAAGHSVRVITGWPNHPHGRIFSGFRRHLSQTDLQDGVRVQRVWHLLPGRKRVAARIAHWLSFSWASFWAILLGPRFDIVYSNTVPMTGPLAIYLATFLRRACFVYGIFDIYPEAALEAQVVRAGLFFRLCRWMDTWVCRQAVHIRVIGHRQKETLLKRGLLAGKIDIVPLWLDKTRVHPLAGPSSWRLENGIGPDTFVVLYAGTIGLISGAGVVLDVAGKMRGQANVLFLFVGEGAMKAELARRVAAAGLTNVRFLPFQPEERLNEVFQSADIGLVTLLPGAGKNSVPSKVLGYLAAGLPVVASADADSDVAIYLREGRCGQVGPSGDADALHLAVETMMDRSLRDTCALAARQCFEENFARSAGTTRCCQLFQESLMKTSYTPLGRQIHLVSPWLGKRAWDILLAALALLVLSPVLLCIALVVKLTSPGPVFYRDNRLGCGGKIYAMLKFRSMRHNAPPLLDANGKLIVGRADARLTPVGRVLRILHLDEIPQLFNVIGGSMSFVGPRSGQPAYEKDYTSMAYERLRVQPGITGLGAVVGGRHLENESLYAVEAAYVRHQCLWLDLLIMVCTPIYILFGAGFPRRLLARQLVGVELVELNSKSEN